MPSRIRLPVDIQLMHASRYLAITLLLPILGAAEFSRQQIGVPWRASKVAEEIRI